MKPYKAWDTLPINWCRISAINSRNVVFYILFPFYISLAQGSGSVETFRSFRPRRPGFPVVCAMCQGACCNDFASNPEMQLVYVVGAVVYSLATLLVVILAFVDSNILIVEWTFSIIGLGIFILWITMISSRCCAPCCCKELMPDVPSPCPPGPMAKNNLVVLDYPFMIGVSGDLVTSFGISLISGARDSVRGVRDSGSLEVLRIIRVVTLLWGILMAIGAATGFLKYRLLCEQKAMRQVVPPGTMIVGTPMANPDATVVGAPVQVPSKVVA